MLWHLAPLADRLHTSMEHGRERKKRKKQWLVGVPLALRRLSCRVAPGDAQGGVERGTEEVGSGPSAGAGPTAGAGPSVGAGPSASAGPPEKKFKVRWCRHTNVTTPT